MAVKRRKVRTELVSDLLDKSPFRKLLLRQNAIPFVEAVASGRLLGQEFNDKLHDWSLSGFPKPTKNGQQTFTKITGALFLLPENQQQQEDIEDQQEFIEQILEANTNEELMYIAAMLNNDQVMQQLTDEGVNGLFVAAIHGDELAIQNMLDKGNRADEPYTPDHNKTPLHMAALYGNGKAVIMLQGEGADVNTEDDRELRAVHYAALGGQGQLVEKLASDRNAILTYPTFLDKRKATPARELYLNTISSLQQKGRSLNLSNKLADKLQSPQVATSSQNHTVVTNINPSSRDETPSPRYNEEATTPLMISVP